MNKPDLDPMIMKKRMVWGENFDSMVGCEHNPEADKVSPKITSKKVTLNTEMDPEMAKPKSQNPGVDKKFWAKAEPQADTTGHGRLTRATKDESRDRM